MGLLLPATGTQISMGIAKRAIDNLTLGGAPSLLRGTLGAHYGLNSGALVFSTNLGGRPTPYDYPGT